MPRQDQVLPESICNDARSAASVTCTTGTDSHRREHLTPLTRGRLSCCCLLNDPFGSHVER